MTDDTDVSGPKAPCRIVIVAGMPRAATTFLYHTLANHPKAWIPPRKELEYFSVNAHRGSEWYYGFFEGAAADQVGFDISPIYFMVPETPDRIRSFDPDARVVLLVRDPVEFVLSFFANRQGASHGGLEFEDFLDGHMYSKDGQTVEFVFEDGRIQKTLERFREVFEDRLLLCSYDAIGEDPLPVLKAIEAFSGLPSYFTPDNFENVRVNASDQRNIVWLNWMMHQRWFADLVVRLIPRTLILKARYWVQTRRTASGAIPDDTADRNRRYAEERLASDRAYVQELFRDRPMLLGNGRSVDRE